MAGPAPPAGSTGRPFFRTAEVDRMAIECLRSTSLYPDSPGPIRVERFVEKYFRLGGVMYETLPAGVLGCTVFGDGEVQAVLVSKDLCDDPSKVAERRLRTTLAHEAGHGLMHGYLFRGALEASLFEDSEDVEESKVLCRDPGGEAEGYRGRWWEVQANMMIGSLLLPGPLVQEAVRAFCEETSLGALQLPSAERQPAVLEVADVFNVNPVVAKIRLERLFPVNRADQLTL